MTTYREKFDDQIEILECDWCQYSPGITYYRIWGDIVCSDCIDEQYEESEHGLTNEERNK